MNIADTISLGAAARMSLVPRVSVLAGAQWEFVEYNTQLKEIPKKRARKIKSNYFNVFIKFIGGYINTII